MKKKIKQFRALMVATIAFLALLISNTEAFGGDVHDISLTLFRDVFAVPEKEWTNDHCFSLTFDSPYINSDFWAPFDPANPPECQLTTSTCMKIRCSIGSSNNELQFSLFDITCPEAPQILLEITNFQNPWSAITISSIRLYAYGQDTCFGTDKIGSDPISPQRFFPKTMLESNIEISSSSNVIGYSGLDNAVTFKFTPSYSTSPTKNGRIVIDFPLWFDVADDLNMMFNRFAKNTCTSTDFNVISSYANLIAKQLTINYDSMADNKVKGEVISITCTGFKNPISQGLWPGFKISLLDNEQESRNLIEESEVFSFNTNLQQFSPATIRKTDLTIAPSTFQIAEYSTWLVALTDFPIPLEQQCWIQFTIPPDLLYRDELLRGQGMFEPVGQPLIDATQKDTVGIVIKFEGCSSDTSVGALPQGILLIDFIRTPSQRRDTGSFKLAIYSDDTYENKSLIAKIDNGLFIPTGELQPNVIEFISVVPENSNNQVITDLAITIKLLRPIYDRPNIEFKFPPSITLPAIGQSVAVVGSGHQYDPATSIVSSTQIPLAATSGTVLEKNVIKIQKIFGDDDPPEVYLELTFVIKGIQNPLSVRQAGDFEAVTYSEGFEPDMIGRSDGSYVSTTGQIDGQIIVANSVTSGTNSEYQIIIKPDSMVPKNGFIEIQIPERVILRPLELLSSGICTSTDYTCLSVENNVFKIQIKIDVPAKVDTTIVIKGITNPRNDQSTGKFHIITYDVDGAKKIDEGFDKDTRMENLAPIDSFFVVPQSDVNHVVNTYTFIISTSVTVIDGDSLIFNLPASIAISEPTTVTPIPRTINNNQVSDVLQLKINGQQITVTFISVAPALGEAYKFTIDKIKNPLSERPSDPFTDIRFEDTKGFGVQAYNLAPVVIENKEPAEMITYELRQNNYVDLQVTTYWIHFTPVNPIPRTGSFIIHWPKKVEVPDTVKCTVRTNFDWEDRCEIDQGTRAIKITNFFSGSETWSTNVIVTLEGVTNPRDNKLEGQGFLIYTYIDLNQQYRIDLLPQDKLVPKLECDYPCRTCLATDRTYCKSCWTDDWSELKYHILIDGIQDSRGHCGTQCPLGYGRDNDNSHICIACGERCDVCKDEDKDHCLECSDLYPYSLSGTGICLKSCSQGYFLTTTPMSCATCDLPCTDCYGNAKYCIDCDRNSNFPVLFNNRCERECPPGFYDDGKECQPCLSPCETCVGSADFCTDCDGTLGRRYFYQNKCYETCPVNASPDQQDESNLFCKQCTDPKCEICNNEDPTKCDRCFFPYYVQDDVCVELCSSGLHTNADKTACVVWTIYDFGILPFPWLCLTFIACFIILLGKCRKTRGRTKFISTQNTITCFIVIIAFIQFWAVISLGVWAFLYDTTPFMFYASCGLLAALIILNIVFHIFYKCNFDRLITPDDKHAKYKKGILTKAELKKFIQPKDEDFHKYGKKHSCITCCVCCTSCLCTFKCNKNYYSRCCSFDCFKARWHQGKYYRKSMTIFCVVSMVLDALILCVCIAGLLTMTALTTMLWVTTVEVAVLSLLLIIFGCIELCQLKEILRYNEKEKKATWGASNKQKQIQVSSANPYFAEKDSDRDYSQREFLPKHVLLMNKEKSQDMFLDKKLDNLLNLFGDRRCKSMTELCTGWDKEEDLHQVNSWPLSPKKIKEYDGVYHFTYADRMGSCFDNVYAQEKMETKLDEKAIQGDQDQQDFTRLFFQKQGNLIAGKIDDEDEWKARSGQKRGRDRSRRRGRTNKFNAAIDAEDGDQVDAIDQFRQELDEEERQKLQQILKEQEEEEAMLRQKVEDDRKKQEEIKAQRRAKLAETERLLREAEAAEAEIRRQADEKEQFLQQLQQQQELELQRENDILRAKLAKEEEEARRKAEEDAKAHAEYLAAKNESNRIKYEKEDADRKQKLEEEKARMKKLREENESRMIIEKAEMNRKILEEAEMLQSQKDSEELRLRQQLYKSDDEQRQKDKEEKRIQKEQSDIERKSIEKMNIELKRASRLEQEKIQHQAFMQERQKKLDQEAEERNATIRMDDEKRQKLLKDDVTRNQKLEQQAQLKRDLLYKADEERKVLEEQERKVRLELEEEERKARIQRYDAESLAKINKREAEKKAEKEAKQMRKEAEQKRKKQLDEAERKRQRELKIERQKENMRDKEVQDLQARQDQVKARLREIEDKQADQSHANLNDQDKQDLEQEKMRLIDTRVELGHQEDQLKHERQEHEKRKRQREMEEAKQKALHDEQFEKQLQEAEKLIREGKDDPGDDVMMSLEPLGDAFGKKGHPVEMPPNADNRTFNVNDILGELDRDDRGQVIILRDSLGNKVDKTGHAINEKGYMINQNTGDVIENYTGKKLFNAADLDDKGEIPQPFCLERFNFNPHDLMGDLDYQYDQSTGRAILKLNQTKQGFYIDKKKRRVNRFGWLVQGNTGHIIDRNGRKKFDKKQLDDGDVQKLYNYNGKRFNVKDVIGAFEKNSKGDIILNRAGLKSKVLTDSAGRKINHKGYLIDDNGNIIDRVGKLIFHKQHLKKGEFPKIFFFSKFNVESIKGDCEMSPLGEPIIDTDPKGNLVDLKGRLVNSLGYLTDHDGNVIDKRGNLVFDKPMLGIGDDDIPKVFKMQILKTDSGSSLSRFGMDATDYNQQSAQFRPFMEESGRERWINERTDHSAMGESPVNYSFPVQPFEQQQQEDNESLVVESRSSVQRLGQNGRTTAKQSDYDVQANIDFDPNTRKKRGKKKKKNKDGYLEYFMPTEQQIGMAGAYGGQAKGFFKQPGVLYNKNVLKNRIRTPADIPGGRTKLKALADIVSGFQQAGAATQQSMFDDQSLTSGRANRPNNAKRDKVMSGSQDGFSSLGSQGKVSLGATRRHQAARTQLRTQQKPRNANQIQDDRDFEKMFGDDIDKYLEGDSDLEEYDKLSHLSRGTDKQRAKVNANLRQMEDIYLRRVGSDAVYNTSNVSKKQSTQARTPAASSTTYSVMQSRKKKKSVKKQPTFRD